MEKKLGRKKSVHEETKVGFKRLTPRSRSIIEGGKGQNVENHFIESQKKNIESLQFEKDQNVESQIRLSMF
jgi:hypothetical protein